MLAVRTGAGRVAEDSQRGLRAKPDNGPRVKNRGLGWAAGTIGGGLRFAWPVLP